MPEIQTLINEAVDKLKAAQKQQFDDLQKEVDEAKRKGEGLADVTQKFEAVNGEVAKLTDEIKKLAEQQAAEKAEAARKAVAEMEGRLAEFERKYGSPDAGGRIVDTLGRRFVKAMGDEASFEEAARNNKTRKISLKAGDYFDRRGAIKDISGDAASGGVLQDSLRVPGVVTQPETALSVQELLPRTTTTARTIDYVRELLFTNSAAAVAENTAVSGATAKPKSNITFESKTEAMHTIAHWIAASRQILRYSSRTQLQQYIDGRLRYGLGLVLEDEILTGDGTGNHLEGLVPQASAYDRGYDNIQGAAPTKIDTLRRAITQARLAEYPVTGMVLHPGDLEDITLAKGSDLHYIWAMPGQTNVPRPWGVSVAESTRMTEGEFLVGAFALGAELYVGEEINVVVSREHASFLIENLVAILAEGDFLLAVYRPEAFVSGPFAAATT